MPTITFLSAITAMAVGAAVLWANPRRTANRMFSVLSFHWAAWLLAVFCAMQAGLRYNTGDPYGLVFWLRANTVIAAMLPVTMRLLTEALVFDRTSPKKTSAGTLPWFVVSAIGALLCFSNSFMSENPLTRQIVRGPAYYAYSAIMFGAFSVWVGDLAVRSRNHSGVQRMELIFVAVSFGFAAIATGTLNTLGHYLHMPGLNRTSIPAAHLGIVFAAIGIAAYRIFDARQIVLSLVNRLGIAATLGGTFFLIRQLLSQVATPDLALFIALLCCVFLAPPLDRAFRRWLGLDDQVPTNALRKKAIAISHSESNPDDLILAFKALLRVEFQASSAQLIFPHAPVLTENQLTLPSSRPGHDALCTLGWATPESLLRRRPSPPLDDLATFLRENSLGLIVAIPHGSPSPSLLIAVGTKDRQAPFTYPEVQRLQAIGELMDNILAHSRLAAEAALKAKMEHLALMSRGLAHDLKNLITPISSFIVHTDGAYAAGTPEAEVHTAAKRSVRIMTDYVREALFFASRLSPRFEPTEPPRVLETVHSLSATRAAQRGVDIVVAAAGPASLTADTVLVQRLLGNLVINAIDASPRGATVTASCSEPSPGWVRFEVADHGVGIPPENLSRIFEPYFTTKDYGDEVRGFGLGLTICEKIVNLHQGTILVKSEPGRGTRVTVDLPSLPTAFAPSPENRM